MENKTINSDDYFYDKEGIDQVVEKYRATTKKGKKKKKKKEKNEYNYNQYNEQNNQKKGSGVKKFFVFFLILILLAGGGFAIYYFLIREDGTNIEFSSSFVSSNESLGGIRFTESEGSLEKTATAIPYGSSEFLGWVKDSIYETTIISQELSLTVDRDDQATYYALFNISDSITTNNNIQYRLYHDVRRASAIGYSNFTATTLEVPTILSLTNGNYQVFKIEDNAFENLQSIQAIRLSKDIISIGEEAFTGCSNVSTIFIDTRNLYYSSPSDKFIVKGSRLIFGVSGELPSGITSIAPNALSSANITSITIPSSITEIPDRMFYNSTISYVTLPGTLTKIGNSAFENCKNLSIIYLTDNIVSIGDRAFAGSGLTRFSFPAKVKTIGDSVFAGCQSLGLVTFQDGSAVTSIDGQFDGNNSIETIQFINNNSLESIADYAFSGHSNLRIITFGNNNIKSLGQGAFEGCGITNFTIPAGVSSLPSNLFVDCDNLTSIIFEAGSSITQITSDMFSYISSLERIDFGDNNKILDISQRAFSGLSNLSSVDFGENSILLNIYDNAFYGTSLTSITIPASVSYIGVGAFQCDTLKEANFLGTRDFGIFSGSSGLNRVATISSAFYSDANLMANYLSNVYCECRWMIITY